MRELSCRIGKNSLSDKYDIREKKRTRVDIILAFLWARGGGNHPHPRAQPPTR